MPSAITVRPSAIDIAQDGPQTFGNGAGGADSRGQRAVADAEIVDPRTRGFEIPFVQRGEQAPRLVRLDDHAARVEHRRRGTETLECVGAP
jgi:hypothetical protein